MENLLFEMLQSVLIAIFKVLFAELFKLIFRKKKRQKNENANINYCSNENREIFPVFPIICKDMKIILKYIDMDKFIIWFYAFYRKVRFLYHVRMNNIKKEKQKTNFKNFITSVFCVIGTFYFVFLFTLIFG